jgi:hypothetical protein
MTDLANISLEQKQAVERVQDEHRQMVHRARLYLDSTLVLFNALRAESGLGPVTLRIPEETT